MQSPQPSYLCRWLFVLQWNVPCLYTRGWSKYLPPFTQADKRPREVPSGLRWGCPEACGDFRSQLGMLPLDQRQRTVLGCWAA